MGSHRRVRPNYRWGYWNWRVNVGPLELPLPPPAKPPRVLVLKTGKRFRNCKEKWKWTR